MQSVSQGRSVGLEGELNCSKRRRGGSQSTNHWLVETEFRSRRGREANERVTVGRLMMMRGVQSVGAFWGKAGGWRQAGCAMMMDVIYRLDHPSPPRSTSAAREYGVPQVSVPVEPSLAPSLAAVCPVCRSCPLSPAVWLPCWTARTYVLHLRAVPQAQPWACQDRPVLDLVTDARRSESLTALM